MFFPLLRYVRWEVLSGAGTFLLHGLGRRRLGFVPTEIEGCVLWLRADLGVNLVSGNVSDWKDRSGRGNHFTQSTSASRPTLTESHGSFHGASTLSFDGTDDRLLSAATFASPGAANAFWVLKMQSDQPAQGSKTGIERFGTASTVSHYPYTDAKVYMGFASNSRKTVGDPAQDLSQTHVLEIISTSSEYSVVIGGNQEFTGAGSFGWNTSPIIGGGTLGHFLHGDVAELVIYDRKLDAAERARLQSYFDARYGL